MTRPVPRRPRGRQWASRGFALLLIALPFVSVGCLLNPTKSEVQVQNTAPRVSAAAAPDSGEVPLTVTFRGSASDPDGRVTSYRWDFGDGSTSDQMVAEHVYTEAGDFTATLVATDDRGASTRTAVQVRPRGKSNRKPVATISAAPMSGIAPLDVTFTGSATDADGTVTGYLWSFGDGTTSTLQNPSHAFAMPGTYNVRLSVTDNGGATGMDQVKVVVTSTANAPPVASPSATPTSGDAPLIVAFTGAGSDADGSIASYAWMFGDGGTSDLQNPSHTYSTPGSYTARLTVTDNAGATGMATVLITVNGTANRPPTATASATPTTGTAPLAVSFTGGGTDTDGTIASYAWTFGDGSASSLQSPTHIYSAAGSYTARLTVTDNAGATGTATVAIGVSAASNLAPMANAGADQLNKDPGTTFSLSGAASSDPDGAIASYAWTQVSGPAVTLTGAGTATPSFTSPAATTATWEFRLTVTDNGSPAKSATDNVVVSTRVTYANLVGAWFLARGTQSNGELLGCTSAGCHTGTNSRSPLSTYTQVYSVRSSIRSRIQTNGSMAPYLAPGEASVITAWIDAGAPEKN